MMTVEVNCEEKVRRYLQWLADPKSLVDYAEVDRLQGEFDQSTDVMERLRLAEALERAENPSIDAARAGFVECAKKLSKDNGLSTAAFLRIGVPEADLKQAGFQIDNNHKKRLDGGKKRLTVNEVASLVPDGNFTAKMLQMRSGASPMTVRRAIEQLLDQNMLVSTGTDPEHNSRGRAPLQYTQSKQVVS